MGALADYAALKNGINAFTPGLLQVQSSGTPAAGINALGTVNTFGAPTTAAACTRATTGANAYFNPMQDALTAQYWLAQIGIKFGQAAGLIVSDRLSHQGGLSGTTTGAQTTNLPTAALTRYASGAGVCIGIHIYSAIGSTATTLTASYTNQAGTAGRTTQAIPFGGSNRNTAGLFFPLPLQDGDTGARSVESVTIAASTATAGAFGVVLYKPLCMIPGGVTMDLAGFEDEMWRGGRMVEVLPDACLMVHSQNVNTSIAAGFRVIEA